MSDITKKIFSIEPDQDDILRSAAGEDMVAQRVAPEPVPDFVKRETAVRVSAPPPKPDTASSRWIMWSGMGFAALWLLGAALLFGAPLLGQNSGLFELTGLALLLLMPAMLITLLWLTLRRLMDVMGQSRQIAMAAQALVSPDETALLRTQTLADGIRQEISSVNHKLADTVETLIEVQKSISRESQSLDAAGSEMLTRSDSVTQNLSAQRVELEAIAGTFDTRMDVLTNQISMQSQNLDSISTQSEARIGSAADKVQSVTDTLSATSQSAMDKLSTAIETASSIFSGAVQSASCELRATTEGAKRDIDSTIGQIGEASRKLDTTSEALNADLNDAAQTLQALEDKIAERMRQLETLNTVAHEKVSDLQATVTYGNELLRSLTSEAHTRDVELGLLYKGLENQLQQSEDATLASQGKTSRMVEANLAQMRREFTRMETDMQLIQAKLDQMRGQTEELDLAPKQPAPRLRLKPLDTDFPPVEPFDMDDVDMDDEAPAMNIADDPNLLNLGADMQIAEDQADRALTDYTPDIIRRPVDVAPSKPGFARTKDKDQPGWHWRDMLGTLEPPAHEPDAAAEPDIAAPLTAPAPTPQPADIIGALTLRQLSPSAIVDDGTIIDATQARINKGEDGLAQKVAERLPDPVRHLRAALSDDPEFAGDITAFTIRFAQQIGNTPPTAPSLRAAFSSTQGRAYLLCAAALI